MNRQEMLEKLAQILEEEYNLIVRKSEGYANDAEAFQNFEDIGRMMDMTVDEVFTFFIVHKTSRLCNLIRQKKNPSWETIEDTVVDLANYCNLFLVWKRSTHLAWSDQEIEQSRKGVEEVRKIFQSKGITGKEACNLILDMRKQDARRLDIKKKKKGGDDE
jgi:hypothetical protein